MGNVDNVAIGNNSAAGNGAGNMGNTAIGVNTQVSGMNNTALGANAVASGSNSIAVGYGSSTGSRANAVSVGSPGAERQITNVQDGVYPTDTVNVNQLDHLGYGVDKVGAMAAAISGLAPLSYDPRQPTNAAFAFGTYSGENAFALGIYHYTHQDVLLNAAYAFSGHEKMARFGLTIRFSTGSNQKNISVITPIVAANPEALTPVQNAVASDSIVADTEKDVVIDQNVKIETSAA